MIDENRHALSAVESVRSLEFWSMLFSVVAECKTHLQPLADGKNVSFGVLEPRRLRATPSCDAVDRLDPGHVVFFKLHASRFQGGDFGRNILHRPERGLACDVPAPPDGYMNTHDPFPHS